MRINEIILENDQLDELNLKGLGTGIGKVPGAIAGGVVQGAKNIWQGAKQGYAAGKAALAPDSGSAPQQATAPAQGQQAAPQQAASGGAPQQATAPAQGQQAASGGAPTEVSDFDDQFGVPITPQGVEKYLQNPADERAKRFQAAKAAGYTIDSKTGVFTPPANSSSASGPSMAPATSGAQPGSSAAGAAPQATAMKSAEIVKGLDDIWKKATADQGSETTSPQVQAQIRTIAKQAGLTGQTIKENKIGYYSKFLKQEI